MAINIVKGNIGNALTSTAANHVVAVSQDIYDESVNKYQSDINRNLENKIEEEKAAIIETNRIADGAVTNEKLSTDIQLLISNLSKTATFAGIATPTTNPGTPEGPVFYIANGKGTYTNFGGINVTEDEVVVLYYDTVWHKNATGIASNDKLTELGYYIDNPEYIRVIVDYDGKLLFGIKKDGTIEWGDGVPSPVREYVSKKIQYAIESIESVLSGKVDKLEGKSLIDSLFAQGISNIENKEYLSVVVDRNGKVLESTNLNGKKLYPTQQMDDIAEDREDRLAITMDNKGRILSYIDNTGKINLTFPTNIDDDIKDGLDKLSKKVNDNWTEVLSIKEYNQIKEDKCNNGTKYLVYTDNYHPFKYIQNGKMVEYRGEKGNIAKIVLFGDTHFGYTMDGSNIMNPTAEDRCGMAFEKSNSKNADFAMIMGDILQGGTYQQVMESYNIYYDKLKVLNIPCFPIEGNHDERISVIEHNEITKTGIIEYGKIRIICFNANVVFYPEPNIEDMGDVSDEVYAWLVNAVKDSYENGYITILANHFSLYNDPNSAYWDESIRNHRDDIISLCQQYNVRLYLHGHEHNSGLTHTIVSNNSITLDMTEIMFGLTLNTYSVMEIKEEGFTITEYDTMTDNVLHTLFIPMYNQESRTIFN